MAFDRQLALFRLGAIACLIGAILVATQFDIVESIAAVWSDTPTSWQIDQANLDAIRKQEGCRKAPPNREFSPECGLGTQPFRGMPRDRAVTNIGWFMVWASLLTVAAAGVTWLGWRMAKNESTLGKSKS